jgi:NADPH2:quinone reductase
MRAIWLKEFGGPHVLVSGDAPEPEAGPGQVVIDVAYVNVTFVETQLRAGRGPFTLELPVIPGNGVGGTVRQVGDGVDRALLGATVITSTGGSGAYAERAAVDASLPFVVPDALALDDAVALLADGRTAVMMSSAAGIRVGDRVLVEAAAGGVGSLLVQLARRAGATVIAVAGGPRKVALARELGADVAIDYRLDDWTAQVRAATGGVDVVFDGVGGAIGRDSFELLEPGGRMVSFGLASGTWTAIGDDEARARGVSVRRPEASADDLRRFTRRALDLAVAGGLKPVIGQRFPLERAADAHAAMEARSTVGKTLIEVVSDDRAG